MQMKIKMIFLLYLLEVESFLLRDFFVKGKGSFASSNLVSSKLCFDECFLNQNEVFIQKVVRIEGLEPTCLAALDPKSSASANFAISA